MLRWENRRFLLELPLAVGLAVGWTAAAQRAPSTDVPVGGANSPPPSPPPEFVIRTAELSAGPFAVRVPTGEYVAPRGGAPNYSVPGPIAAFRGADGTWRGHGYLETYPRLMAFQGKLADGSAELTYVFEKGKTYKVKLTAASGAVLLDEESDLGPRNLYVFDCYYNWQPSCGFATDLAGGRHAFLYLPCYYDQPEVTINPAAAAGAGGRNGPADAGAGVRPGGVAVLSASPARKDIAGFFCRDVGRWRHGDRMGIQLWQHRQLPGEPGSRHFLGPETKSDSTPNPRTAGLLGKSLYEGHVTIELNLGAGTRRLGFAAAAKPGDKAGVPEAFKRLVRANQGAAR